MNRPFSFKHILTLALFMKTMCDNCKDTITREQFYSAQDYLSCLDYIAELDAFGQFAIIEQTCPLDAVKNPAGKWIADVIHHKIACTVCGDVFSAYADTYHGGGYFKKDD